MRCERLSNPGGKRYLEVCRVDLSDPDSPPEVFIFVRGAGGGYLQIYKYIK